MTLPFILPDWMPGWVFLLLAVPALLWALAFLMVPFNVFGVKARLEAIEGQLDSLQEELRIMQMRAAGALSPAARSLDSTYEDVPDFGRLKRGRAAPPVEEPPPSRRPPIPEPTRGFTARDDYTAPRREPPPARPRRSEPRLD